MSEEINEIEKKVVPREQVSEHLDQSYWGIVKRQFRKNRLAVWSLRFLMFIAIIGLLSDFIANEKPLYCKYKGKTHFPVLKSYAVDMGLSKWPPELANVKWSLIKYESVIWPPVPYSGSTIDFANSHHKGPFDEQRVKSNRWKHWFGTDNLGRDTLAGLISGTRVAMLVGIVSMSISALIGILIGAFAGYFGDNKLKASRAGIIMIILGFFFAYFYAFHTRSYTLSDSFTKGFGGFFIQFLFSLSIFIAIMAVFYFLSKLLAKIPFFAKRSIIAVDILVMRFIEIFNSIPRLLLILSIAAILPKPSLYVIMVIIGLTSWTGIARFIRGELLRVRSLQYIEAAQAMGFSEAKIIFRHAIPNSLTPVLIAVAFGVASAILIESSLSFLGIGVPAEMITWGKMLSEARNAPEAWWLAIFPGFAIFITVTIFNLLGEGLTDALDPKSKQ